MTQARSRISTSRQMEQSRALAKAYNIHTTVIYDWTIHCVPDNEYVLGYQKPDKQRKANPPYRQGCAEVGLLMCSVLDIASSAACPYRIHEKTTMEFLLKLLWCLQSKNHSEKDAINRVNGTMTANLVDIPYRHLSLDLTRNLNAVGRNLDSSLQYPRCHDIFGANIVKVVNKDNSSITEENDSHYN
jgi:hypothetical protein